MARRGGAGPCRGRWAVIRSWWDVAAASGIAHLLVDAETLEEALVLAVKQAEEFDRLRAMTAGLRRSSGRKGS